MEVLGGNLEPFLFLTGIGIILGVVPDFSNVGKLQRIGDGQIGNVTTITVFIGITDLVHPYVQILVRSVILNRKV